MLRLLETRGATQRGKRLSPGKALPEFKLLGRPLLQMERLRPESVSDLPIVTQPFSPKLESRPLRPVSGMENKG